MSGRWSGTNVVRVSGLECTAGEHLDKKQPIAGRMVSNGHGNQTETRYMRIYNTSGRARSSVKSEEENSLFSSNQREPTRSAPKFCPALIL